jgi:hypothetical protein
MKPEGSRTCLCHGVAWRVRTVSGMGDARALSSRSWSARWVKLPPAKTRELLMRALQRHNGPDRLAALIALSNSDPLLADSKCFGVPAAMEPGEVCVDTPAYLSALCALKFILEKEYTAAERDAATVGGQEKPHTNSSSTAATRQMHVAMAPLPPLPPLGQSGHPLLLPLCGLLPPPRRHLLPPASPPRPSRPCRRALRLPFGRSRLLQPRQARSAAR